MADDDKEPGFIDSLISSSPGLLYAGLVGIAGLIVSLQLRIAEIDVKMTAVQETLKEQTSQYSSRLQQLENRVRDLEIEVSRGRHRP
jgi:phytoene/squalene synthetase